MKRRSIAERTADARRDPAKYARMEIASVTWHVRDAMPIPSSTEWERVAVSLPRVRFLEARP
jgi:hypothetical protein